MEDNIMSENAYKQAGVDVEAGYESVRLIKDDVKKTAIEGVIGGIGGFGGLFEVPKGYEEPVLVSGTDGVGTKIRVAFLMDKHDTIGQDCVAMCVNDIACSGARPLFFLDYLAIGKNVPEKVAKIVKGVADGCVKAETLGRYSEELGKTIGEELLTPTRIYVKPLLKLIDEVGINTVSHITGGGFIENVPRMLPDGLRAVIRKGSWKVLPIFEMMQRMGDIPERDMYNTFNMGLGMIVAVDADKADAAVKCLEEAGETAYIVGELIKGEKGVDII